MSLPLGLIRYSVGGAPLLLCLACPLHPSVYFFGAKDSWAQIEYCLRAQNWQGDDTRNFCLLGRLGLEEGGGRRTLLNLQVRLEQL